jgi:hypothetical protein
MADLVPQQPTTRASDADRDRVLQVLATATSDGRLSVEEHHERMTQTLHARTIGELEVITSDLSAAATPAPTPVPVTSSGPIKGMLAIFGARSRKGAWHVPTESKATAIFGAVELDFRDASFESTEVLLIANSIFGAVEITVPEWVRVIDEGSAIFGAREETGRAGAEHTVTLRLKGTTMFGAVEVKRKAPKLPKGSKPELSE